MQNFQRHEVKRLRKSTAHCQYTDLNWASMVGQAAVCTLRLVGMSIYDRLNDQGHVEMLLIKRFSPPSARDRIFFVMEC